MTIDEKSRYHEGLDLNISNKESMNPMLAAKVFITKTNLLGSSKLSSSYVSFKKNRRFKCGTKQESKQEAKKEYKHKSK